MRRLGFAITIALGLTAGGVCAQQGTLLDTGSLQSDVLVIDFDRAFADSAFGRGLNDRIDGEGAAIVAENRRIEAELTEEEKRLTKQRSTMSLEDFRVLADAFDEKVQKLRAEQDAKAEALGKLGDQSRIDFLNMARPVLERLMRESNAAVVLERRGVLVAADSVDITDRVIERIDAMVAAGQVPDAVPGDAATDAVPPAPAQP